ncbi:MAG: metallophosphoesterase [Myxococcaceae bacterium]|nr:MAG: metallophosphoesterase [Myxococcaceae bacterium]
MRIGQLLLFIAVVLLVVGGIHFFLWARLFRDPAWSARWTRAGGALLASLGLSLPLLLIVSRWLPRAVATPLAWAVFVWMGGSFLLFVLLTLAEAVRLAAAAVGALHDPGRRRWFSRAVAALSGLGGLGTSAFSVRAALAAPTVRTVRVPLAALPAAMDGYTLVQLTDIHVGPTIDRRFMVDLVARVNALRADAVVITGDLVDGSVASLGEHVAPLAELRARHGVFFVTGNHEYYSGVEEWMAELARLGVRVLRNERVSLGDGAASIDLAGVDDWSAAGRAAGHRADLAGALRDRDPTRALVLLAHQPKAVAEAAARGVGLVLSGHTHGGQLWPFSYVVSLDQPIVAGLHRVRDTWAYVSEGTGYWGPPMRLGTRGEITKVVLTLTRGGIA